MYGVPTVVVQCQQATADCRSWTRLMSVNFNNARADSMRHNAEYHWNGIYVAWIADYQHLVNINGSDENTAKIIGE